MPTNSASEKMVDARLNSRPILAEHYDKGLTSGETTLIQEQSKKVHIIRTEASPVSRNHELDKPLARTTVDQAPV